MRRPPARVDEGIAINNLASERLFAGVNTRTLDRLIPHARLCRLPSGRKLHLERSDGQFVYIVRCGFVTIRCTTKLLDWDNFLAWRGPGDLVGELGALHLEPSPVIVRTTDPCEFIELPVDILLETAEAELLIYKNLAGILAGKIMQQRKRSEVMQIPRKAAMRLVARTLCNLIEERSGQAENSLSDRFHIAGTIRNVDIAGYLGMGREAVGDNMKLLRDAGIISYGDIDGENDGRIEVLNRKRLENAR